MNIIRCAAGALLLAGTLHPSPPARAQSQPDVSAIFGAFAPMRADIDLMRARGFAPTGLHPVYPRDADCPTIDSAFAVRTRGDGSSRNPRFFHGYHGGIDIPVAEGTPVLAVADGTVVHASEGLSIGGITLVLQHAPADTGLPLWLYTEYKHLRDVPPLPAGTRVRKGEAVAVSGKTGTDEGRHYGGAGHPHLHLTAFYSARARFWAGRIVIPEDGYWMDPLALFRGPPFDTDSLRVLPDSEKAVPIAYKTDDGRTAREDARFVWPLACKAR